jgi:transcriptional regulator with XRE-family HTH domain
MSGDDVITRNVATKLKEIRLERQLRQIDVAEKVKIHPQYYAKVERAEVRPSIDLYERIAKALKAKASDIFPF